MTHSSHIPPNCALIDDPHAPQPNHPHAWPPACIMQVVHYVVTLDPTSPTPPKPMLPLTLAGYSLPLCTNVMATALITTRIYWLSRGTTGEGFRSARAISRSAMATIVESGALYLAIQVAYVVLLSLEHPVDAIIAVMACQIYVSHHRRHPFAN